MKLAVTVALVVTVDGSPLQLSKAYVYSAVASVGVAVTVVPFTVYVFELLVVAVPDGMLATVVGLTVP